MEYSVSMKKNSDFRRVYSSGKSAAASALVVYYRPAKRDFNQIGITVSTKVGKAVTRNLVRRRIREIYRLNEQRIKKGLDIVVVARVRSPFVTYRQLEKDFIWACGKLGILMGRSGEAQEK